MNTFYKWEKSISRWDEAVPLGSGKCGCLCWGEPREMRFSLDRTDIWDKTVLWEQREDFTYENLVSLAKEGNVKKIREIFDAPYYYPTPTKLPAGKIIIRFPDTKGEVRSSLSLGKAVAEMKLGDEKSPLRIKTWVHAVRHIGVIEVCAPEDSFSAELLSPDFGEKGTEKEYVYREEEREISQGTLKELKYPPACRGEEQNLQWFIQPVNEEFSYGIVMLVEKSCERTRILWKILSSEDGENWLSDGKKSLLQAAQKAEKEFFREHEAWWEHYFGESSISLPDKFMEKQWYMANYLFASASREGCAPMPLQGVWTADDGTLPPWKGDYHHDLNTELSYTHYLKANHLEEGKAFLDFLWELLEEGKRFAKEFYHVRGCCLPGVMTIDGKPLGGWPMYSLSPANQAWLAHGFGEYYRYTGDAEFLRERAYPYMKETGIFLGELLEERDDGTLSLPVSSSPEIHDDTEKAWLIPMSNYDLALLLNLYESLEKYSILLKDPMEEKWKEIRKRLPKLAVNEKKVLMLSPDESLEESHRHFSNAIAVSPLGLISCEGEGREIIDAVIKDYERLGTGQWVGYTFTWMAHLYALQGNGEKAAEYLNIFWKYFCGPNGFHLNGDFQKKGYSDFTYRPFTLEGNMFGADALQEMLFQMKDGKIRLFPAIPEEWKEKEVSFENFRGENGLMCSAKIEDGILTWKIRSEKSRTVSLGIFGEVVEESLEGGKIRTGTQDMIKYRICKSKE